MHRPVILRYGPRRLRQSLWSRFYRPTPKRWIGLYEKAPLDFGRGVEMKLVPGDVISDSIAFTGVYELPFTRWLISVARKEGGVMLDVGANLGYFSLLWAAQSGENRSVAFEASPRNLSLLEHNVRHNALDDRIDVRREAVGAERGTMQFELGPPDQTGWGGLTVEASDVSIAVDVVTLDDAISVFSQIAVLKIDIEGADFWALKGAERMLREQRVRHVWWEENRHRMWQLGISSTESEAFMRSVGYAATPQDDLSEDLVNWYARPMR